MSLTLDQMCANVRGKLNQFSTTRDQTATFNGWVTNGTGAKVGALFGNVIGTIQNGIVELGTEQIYVESHDETSQIATCPPWFRGYGGSPRNDSYPIGSMAILNPRWPWWSIAQEINNGVDAIYPDLFAARTIQLTTVQNQSRYQLPADCDDILNIKVQPLASWRPQVAMWQWSMESTAADGNKYVHIVPRYGNGLPLIVTYRAAPTPFTYDPTQTWDITGLPASASDLPTLYAVSALLPSADAARTQSSTIVQSDANRFAQIGTAGTVSNHFDVIFNNRVAEERKRLMDKYVSHTRLVLNG